MKSRTSHIISFALILFLSACGMTIEPSSDEFDGSVLGTSSANDENSNIIFDQPLREKEKVYVEEELKEDDLAQVERKVEDPCVEDGNLIYNPSFECSDQVNDGWDVFDNIKGWHIDSTYNNAGLELQCGKVGSMLASEGRCHAELDAHIKSGLTETDVKIYQKAAVEKGSCYELSFDYSARMDGNAGSNVLYVQVDDQLEVKHAAEETGWNRFEHLLKAEGDTITVSFAASIDGDSLGAQLDMVRLSEAECTDPKEEAEGEYDESLSENIETETSEGMVCEDSSLAVIWGDLEGSTKQWNRFGHSHIRILNQESKIAAQDLVKFDKHDHFYGNQDQKTVTFYTDVITHFDGMTLAAKHCYKKGAYENPKFEIQLGTQYKKTLEVKKDRYFSYQKLKGENITEGHGLLVMAHKGDHKKVQFLAGSWKTKTFTHEKNKKYKGSFHAKVYGHLDQDGKINGKWGALHKEKKIFKGFAKMHDGTHMKIQGKHKKFRQKKNFGVAGGKMTDKDADLKHNLRIRYFHQNGDKFGTMFGWILKKDQTKTDEIKEEKETSKS